MVKSSFGFYCTTHFLRFGLIFLSFLTCRADAKEVEAVIQDMVSCLLGQFPGQFAQKRKVGIEYLPALRANKMGMRIRSGAVEPVTVVNKSKLHDLSQLFEQRHGLIDGGQTGKWELGSYALINLFSAEMLLI
jgi:hypothetical protein